MVKCVKLLVSHWLRTEVVIAKKMFGCSIGEKLSVITIFTKGFYWREIINHNHLAEEIICLSRQTAPSERVIVFLAVMMQRDKMVKKGADFEGS